MVKLTNLTRVILAVLVFVTQIGLADLCGGLCGITPSHGYMAQAAKPCCESGCAKTGKKCGCAKVASPEAQVAVATKFTTPSITNFDIVLSPVFEFIDAPVCEKSTEVVLFNHGPPLEPPPLLKPGRAPPVV
ncbi:MAG: hypothetical protein KF824_11580 [Fimbriimonadaceae bacterium]|nr:MAG: hypothetical protein KF824_11580 [Fimbriimonadaceae bacterium]